MSVVVMAFAILAGLAGWWLARQRLTAKPWLEQGVLETGPTFATSADPAKRTGLAFVLAVVGSMFALVVGVWFMRSDFGDWRALPMPPVVWLNTGVLLVGSAALELTQRAVRARDIGRVRVGLLASLLFGVVFLVGQVVAWFDLAAAGYVVSGNPANSFFYMATGLHGLHIVGGLAALGWALAKAFRSSDSDDVRLNVELCATYWLFMLFVWMVLLVLLAGWAGDFIAFCRELLS